MCNANAQPGGEEAAVKAAVNVLFEAMRNSDSTLLVSAFSDSAILQTIHQTKDGKVRVKTESIHEFGSSISKAPKSALDERIEFASIHIDGPLASVWTPYKFYYQNKFIHCGANSFQMIHTPAGWKIQYLTDTRRKTGCE